MNYGYNPYLYYPGQQAQAPQQIQNSGFVSVRSIEEAFNYPVAPGNSITFKDENAPYVYTKTKGTSPMEAPVFERYRLVKEDITPQSAPNEPVKAFDSEGQINLLWEEINALKSRLEGDKPIKRTAKKVEADEQ